MLREAAKLAAAGWVRYQWSVEITVAQLELLK
jgi:hypothetical protein